MTSKEDIKQNKISELKNYIPIIIDDNSVKEYFKLVKQCRHAKKQHTLKIKAIKKNYKKNISQLKNKYKMYYNIIDKEYNTSLSSIQNKLKLINYNNIFYKQLTNYIDMLFKKYDHNLVFRAFYFSFLIDIYIMIQDDKHIINLNKLTEKEQKQFIDRTIQHLIQFYNGFIPKKEYKFYSLEFTTKHFKEDSNFDDNYYNEFKNNQEFLIFYNVCYNLHFIRREFVFDYINLDKIVDKYYKKIKQTFNKEYFKNNFWISDIRKYSNKYVEKIRQIYDKHLHYNYPFSHMYLIYIFGDVLYQPPKNNYYGFDNEDKLNNYFEEFLEQIPYTDFYFGNKKYDFDNEINYSDIEEDENDEDENDEDENDEPDDEPDDDESDEDD